MDEAILVSFLGWLTTMICNFMRLEGEFVMQEVDDDMMMVNFVAQM